MAASRLNAGQPREAFPAMFIDTTMSNDTLSKRAGFLTIDSRRSTGSSKWPSLAQIRSLNEEKSSLLKLPRGLRQRIIELAVVEAEPIRVGQPKHTELSLKTHAKLPSLLQICRQLRVESAKIYFSQNTFRICFGDCMFKQWLNVVVGDRRRYLRFINDGRPDSKDFDDAYQAASSLDKKCGLKSGTVSVFWFKNEKGCLPEAWWVNGLGVMS